MAKSKYTPENVDAILKAISLGLTDTSAYEYAGISKDTFYTWIKEYPDFLEKLKKARSANKAYLVSKIREAGQKQWQAHAWLLERCHPQEFGSLVRQQISGGINEYSKDDITELERKAEELARKLTNEDPVAGCGITESN